MLFIYRIGSKLIIEGEENCNDCVIEIFQIDGKILKSNKMNGKRMQIELPVENLLKVVVIKEDQSVVSKLIR